MGWELRKEGGSAFYISGRGPWLCMWRPLGRLCAEYYGIMHYPRGSLWLGDGGIYPPLVGVQIRDREYWVIDYDLTANFLRYTEPDIPMSYPYSSYRGQYVAEASRW